MWCGELGALWACACPLLPWNPASAHIRNCRYLVLLCTSFLFAQYKINVLLKSKWSCASQMEKCQLWRFGFSYNSFWSQYRVCRKKHPGSISAILGSCQTPVISQVTLVRQEDHWCCGSVGWRCPGRREGLQGVGTSPSWLGVRCEGSGECKAGVCCGFRSKLL